MLEPPECRSRTIRGPYGTRKVTAVVSPSCGVQLSMKSSNDCTAERATAKTRLRTTPATVPARMRVRSMVRALRPHRRFSPPTLQSEFVILHRAKRHPAIGHDFLDAKAERGGGSSLAYDPRPRPNAKLVPHTCH